MRPASRSQRGHRAYQAGLAAEQAVQRRYVDLGYVLRETRWRGRVGEIDLIFEHQAGIVFVEVKQSRDTAQAAAHLSAAQQRRIYDTAAEYLQYLPDGQLTETRLDVALVDQAGCVTVLENAIVID